MPALNLLDLLAPKRGVGRSFGPNRQDAFRNFDPNLAHGNPWKLDLNPEIRLGFADIDRRRPGPLGGLRPACALALEGLEEPTHLLPDQQQIP
jgi:hypothetical protein